MSETINAKLAQLLTENPDLPVKVLIDNAQETSARTDIGAVMPR